MKKIILLSDIHIASKNPASRLDDLTKNQYKKLEFILKYAKKNNYPIIQGGDFFHQARSYSVLDNITKLLNKYEMVKLFGIAGNHDMLLRSSLASNLSLMFDNGTISHLGSEPNKIGIGAVEVYGADYGNTVPEVIDPGSFNILVVHDNIANEEMNLGTEKIIKAKDFLKEHKDFNLILCSHIHKHFIVKVDQRIICNTGSLTRHSASKYNMTDEALPRFFVFDTETNEIETVMIPCKKGSKVLSREKIEAENEMNKLLNSFSDAITDNDDKSNDIDFVSNIELYIKKHKISNSVKALISNIMITEE